MGSAVNIFLVADVGGTNTRVGLSDGAVLRPESVRKYPNAQHKGLEDVLRTYLAQTNTSAVDATCVAVAGPVREGVGELTNLAWTFDAKSLAAATGAARVAVLNDLQAQGFGLDHIVADNLKLVVPGMDAGAQTTQLTVGVGTGFNAAPVFRAGGVRIVPPSESGHGPLPVSNETELALFDHIRADHGYAAVEEVLSGRGLEGLYAFFAARAGVDITKDATKDAAQIMAAMADGTDPVAETTVAQFVSMLGVVVGNLALVQLPFGGIYLIGGVARAMAPYFDRFGFAEAFHEKGRFTKFMTAFCVYVVEDDFAALTGCAVHLDAGT